MRYLFGTWCHDEKPLTPEEVRKICNEAHTRRARFAAYPADKVLRVLDRMRALWLDPAYEKRKSLEAMLTLESGFSPEMVRLGFNDLNVVFNPSFLEKKIIPHWLLGCLQLLLFLNFQCAFLTMDLFLFPKDMFLALLLKITLLMHPI